MGRFAKKSESIGGNEDWTAVTARPRFSRSRRFNARPQQPPVEDPRLGYGTPSDRKYFVLAVVALIGIGLCSLLVKAITDRSPKASSPAAVERFTTGEGFTTEEGGRPQVAALAAEKQPAGRRSADTLATIPPKASGHSAKAAPSSIAPTPIRQGGKVTRRMSRPNPTDHFITRPFKAIRKIKIW